MRYALLRPVETTNFTSGRTYCGGVSGIYPACFSRTVFAQGFGRPLLEAIGWRHAFFVPPSNHGGLFVPTDRRGDMAMCTDCDLKGINKALGDAIDNIIVEEEKYIKKKKWGYNISVDQNKEKSLLEVTITHGFIWGKTTRRLKLDQRCTTKGAQYAYSCTHIWAPWLAFIVNAIKFCFWMMVWGGAIYSLLNFIPKILRTIFGIGC